jgi:hypothetical protein
MSNREQLETQIRYELEHETSGIRLSNKLFSPPDGLFCLLGASKEERRAIVQAPLFRQALARLAELRGEEMAAFSHAAEAFQTHSPEGDYVLKLEDASGTP